MQTIVLDDHGQAWDSRSWALRRFLHCPAPDFDFLRYLIDNLGFVTVTPFRSGSARIRMHFERAAPASVAAAIYLVADMGLERVVVSHSDASFVDRLHPSIPQAVAYIDERVAEPHWQATAKVQSRQLPVATLMNGKGPLPELLARWSSLNQSDDPGVLKRTLSATSATRFMAIEWIAGRLTIADLGSGFESFGKTWRENARGLPVEEQPDYEYGRWVQGMYETVLETEQPRLDDIEATIRRPHLNDRIRVSYRRLILPFRHGRRGQIGLIGASLVRQSARVP